MAGRCSSCGTAAVDTSVATSVEPIDTTGLPPGAIFGASTVAGTTVAPRARAGVPMGATDDGVTKPLTGAPAASRSALPLNVGQDFGTRYHVIKLLGVGGMGAVYQAWDSELEVAVALKVIRTDRRHRTATPEAEKRFKNELLLARQVTHKNVVRIHDLGEIDGIKYITMPYIHGEDLATALRRDGKLSLPVALQIARQIAAGLEAAHEAGVVHRDLKPPNVMITVTPEEVHAQIMDFGISVSSSDATSGGIIGTLEYMAPEQSTGGPVDARADIYAFGLILYELLTGPRQVPQATPQARIDAMKQRCQDGMVPLRQIDASIPEPLEALVMRCLEPDAAARFQTTRELCAALAALDDEGELIPIARFLTRRLMAATAALVIMLLTGTWYFASRPPPPEPPPVSVLLADLDNQTGDELLNGTLEPALVTMLEGASFLRTYRSDAARQIAAQLQPGSKVMDEALARLVAVREGVDVVIATAVARQGNRYVLSARAVDAATGNLIAEPDVAVSSRDAVLAAVGRVSAPLRSALGDSTPQSQQLAAAETFTAASLEAAHEYSLGQQLQQTNAQEAMRHYQNAVQLDPKLGRAYAGLAITSIVLRKRDDAEKYYQQALSLLDRMSERERLRTLGNYYGAFLHNYDKAVETFENLVSLYPGDDVAFNNLSVAYGFKLQFGKAADAIKRARDLNPTSIRYQFNYVTYLLYAGDFATAVTEGQRIVAEHPEYDRTYLPLGLSLLARGDAQDASDVYAKLGQINPSVAAIGKADIEMYFGRYRPALKILLEGIAADARDKKEGEMALKYVAAAEAHLALGEKAPAIQAARKAVQLSSDESVQFPAARALIAAGDEAGADKIAAALDNTLQTQSRSYAQLIRAEIALARKQYAEAIDRATAAQKQHDSWISHFLLGRVYVEAGHYAEAFANLDTCIKRQGETADWMFANSATLRYLPPLYYWTARAQAGVGTNTAAIDNYRKFLDVRAASDVADPLVAAARAALPR